MGKIRVDTALLEGQAATMQDIAQSLTNLSQRIDNIKGGINWKIAASGQIRESLSRYSNYTEQLGVRSNNMSRTLRDISKRYQTAEQNCGKLDGNGNSASMRMSVNSTVPEDDFDSEKNSKWKYSFSPFSKLLSGFFNTFGNIDNIAKLGLSFSSALALAKDGNGLISQIYEYFKNAGKLTKLARMDPGKAWKVGFKRFFGWNDMFNGRASQASSPGARFYNNWHKLTDFHGPFDGYTLKDWSGRLKIAGAALSLASNGYENYKLYQKGEMGGLRAVAQTVTETGVDIVKNWAISATVAAAIASTGVGAPVVVVGAATVCATMLLDYVSEKITGKKVTKLVSDFALDRAEMAIDGVKYLYKNGAKKSVQALGNQVKKQVTTVARTAGQVYGKVKGWLTSGIPRLAH